MVSEREENVGIGMVSCLLLSKNILLSLILRLLFADQLPSYTVTIV